MRLLPVRPDHDRHRVAGAKSQGRPKREIEAVMDGNICRCADLCRAFARRSSAPPSDDWLRRSPSNAHPCQRRRAEGRLVVHRRGFLIATAGEPSCRRLSATAFVAEGAATALAPHDLPAPSAADDSVTVIRHNHAPTWGQGVATGAARPSSPRNSNADFAQCARRNSRSADAQRFTMESRLWSDRAPGGSSSVASSLRAIAPRAALARAHADRRRRRPREWQRSRLAEIGIAKGDCRIARGKSRVRLRRSRCVKASAHADAIESDDSRIRRRFTLIGAEAAAARYSARKDQWQGDLRASTSRLPRHGLPPSIAQPPRLAAR